MEVNPSETLVLLGPSGCGKTTLLKLINRLIEPDEGSIHLGLQSITSFEKHELRRKIGYVIQDVGLLPHMTIEENIGLVNRISGNALAHERLLELTQLLALGDDLLDKSPNQLSGGQQQRVGIARALANDPTLVLMDEPFSALDNITRNQLQDDLLHMDSLREKTIILVTHDVQEAFKLADRIVLLNEGVIQQIDTPTNLLTAPANAFVRSFLANDRLSLYLQTASVDDQSLLELLSGDSSEDKKKAALTQVLKKYQP